MTATRMHEQIADGTMELFVDDKGTAANTFEEMIEILTRIFTLIRKHNLSLSASKCELFMTTMVFAGTTVGPQGVQPDLSKLTAIVNWKIPEDALGLVGFLGLTGWFCDLVLGYAKKNNHYGTYYGRSTCQRNTLSRFTGRSCPTSNSRNTGQWNTPRLS